MQEKKIVVMIAGHEIVIRVNEKFGTVQIGTERIADAIFEMTPDPDGNAFYTTRTSQDGGEWEMGENSFFTRSVLGDAEKAKCANDIIIAG